MPAGCLLHDGDEVLGLVVDRDIRTEITADLALVGAARGRDHASAEGFGKLYGRRADTARAAVHEEPIASLQPAALEDVVPDSEVSLGHAARFGHGKALGDRQGLHILGDAVFGIAAAIDERADLVADFPARDAGADSRYLTRDLETRQRRMAGRRRIGAHALLNVRSIDAGGSDLHEDLAVAHLRYRHGRRLKDFRAAFAVERDAGHCCWDRGHGTSPSLKLDWSASSRAELKAGPAEGGKRRRSAHKGHR